MNKRFTRVYVEGLPSGYVNINYLQNVYIRQTDSGFDICGFQGDDKTLSISPFYKTYSEAVSFMMHIVLDWEESDEAN